MTPPAVSLIVPTYQRLDLLDACVASLVEARSRLREPSELIVVADGSPSSPGEVVHEHDPAARVVELQDNVGFSAAVDHGIRLAQGEWVGLFNDDTTTEPEALAELLAAGQRAPRVGSVTPQLRFSTRPEVINSAGVVIDQLGNTTDRLLGAPVADSEPQIVDVFGTSGAAAIYRRAMLDQVGGFDTSFYAHLEDADVAWRAQMFGWRCLYVPSAVVYHHHSATLSHFSDRKYYIGGRNRIRLLAKNADSGMLRRHGVAMVAYDACYVAFVAVRDRTLAPLRGRLAGIREWRRYRRAGSGYRRPVTLARSSGVRGALRRRAVWSHSTSSRGLGSG